MKTFKIIDLWISIGLICIFIILMIFKGKGFGFGFGNDLLFIGYFFVGGWQVISMIIHAATGCFTYGARNVYHWIALIALITIPIGSFLILLFTAPFMAVFYTWLCWREVYIKMKRPLNILR
jgi:hypothetical protein